MFVGRCLGVSMLGTKSEISSKSDLLSADVGRKMNE